MKVKRLMQMSLLTAIALTIFLVEARIPTLAPIPGMKLGLANIVTTWALFTLGPAEAVMILLGRILLGSLFSGSMMSLLYSLSGGLLCFLLSLLLRKLVSEKQIWVVSILGAMAHNIGQLLVATAVMQTWTVWYYAPVLMISGMLAGAFTGTAAQTLFFRFKGLRVFGREKT